MSERLDMSYEIFPSSWSRKIIYSTKHVKMMEIVENIYFSPIFYGREYNLRTEMKSEKK